MALIKKGRFVPVEYAGGTYYIEADDDDENAIEGEFAVSIVEVPFISRKMSEEERKEAERKEKKYYIPATDEIKKEIEKRYKEYGEAIARIIIEREKEKRRAEFLQRKKEEEKNKP